MKVSLNWLAEWVDLSSFGSEAERGARVADLLTSRGIEVEDVLHQSKGLEKVISVKILKRAPHPNADRLSLVEVTTGDGASTQIVCGANNMKAGDIVALALPGALLPNGMVIKQSKIRGETSNGMLCSEEELCLADTSEGILILPATTKLNEPLWKLLSLDDTVLDLNVTANRGDCLSHLGVAREIAAATQKPLKDPKEKPIAKAKLGFSTRTTLGARAPLFLAVEMKGVKVGPSPDWLVKRLKALGQRSISNVVDATNAVMLELGHPLHAYDRQKLRGSELSIRLAKGGESINLLDGKPATLSGEEIVIADGSGPVALAGVMGGADSEVSESSRDLILECALFDQALIRAAASRHQRRTEASHRFERGVDPQGAERAITRLAYLIQKLAGGEIVGMTGSQMPESDHRKTRPISLFLSAHKVTSDLGAEISESEIRNTLKGLGFGVEGQSGRIEVPSWRQDVSVPEDLVEEVARSVGYARIPETLPTLTSAPEPSMSDEKVCWQRKIEKAKDALVRLGLAECIHFGFSSGSKLEAFGFSPSVKVLNPLNEETEWMVPSLLPNLISSAQESFNRHFASEPPTLRLFEIRPVFSKADPKANLKPDGRMETGIQEEWKLAVCLSGAPVQTALAAEQKELSFFDLKGVIEQLFAALGFKPEGLIWEPEAKALSKVLHPGQSATLTAQGGRVTIGNVGKLHPEMVRALKLKHEVWVAELDWATVDSLTRPAFEWPQYKGWGSFPGVERDFALCVAENISARQILQVANDVGRPLLKNSKVFDVYRGDPNLKGMTSIAVRVIFSLDDRSLTDSEVEEISGKMVSEWKRRLGVELRS